MSYNITRWTTKSIKDLIIPLSSFTKHNRKDFHPDIELDDDGKTLILSQGDFQIIGQKHGDSILVESIDISGEFSGTFFREVFEEALIESSGILEATLIWEGGDSITKLKVNGNVIDHEEIDL